MEVLSQGFDKACIDTAELLHLQANSHWETLKLLEACRRPCSVNRLTLYFDLTVYKHRQGEVTIALSPQL